MDRWWDAGGVRRGAETEGVPWYLKGAGRGDGGGVNICLEIPTEMSRMMEQRVVDM
jgi:hypothetical protein